ncbi:MAG: Sec-dependent nitrous-oxide reductase [Bacillota bacterium]
MRTRRLKALVAATLAIALLAGCSKGTTNENKGSNQVTGLTTDATKIAQERGLSPADVSAALKTYVPSGKRDEAVMFSSGGHSGQVIAIGVPSMRILKIIPVFTPESWTGYGYNDETRALLKEGMVAGKEITWGDTHHPNISETNAEYDGQFLFINDKVHGRIGVVDLRDWETKQIVKNPLMIGDHGGAFVTPNTEYVIEGSQYATPWPGTQADIREYKDKYRGALTFWKFDRSKGRIDKTQSFAIELPPYWQDLCDAGKGPSDGFIFCNSINTEMATGKIEGDEKSTNFEAGVSQKDRDYMHVVDWKKAEQVFKAGKTSQINDFPVISLQTAIDEGLLHFVPEPKSPHGNDVTPKGTHVVVGGKLDPHVSVYSVAKIKDAIANKKFEGTDVFGVPIIKFEDALEAQVKVGLGPLHTVFDDKGYAYTSLFLDSAVARWSLGSERPNDGWKLIHKEPVQYNIGHLTALEGDTAKPGGKYLVALNKWAIDRFTSTGPLLPQNLQLVDISAEGTTMPVIYDMAMGIGEPHYAQIIKADRLKSWDVYPEVGWDPAHQKVSPNAVKPGEERVERNGNEVTVYMTAIRSHFTPEHVKVKKGDKVTWHITNLDKVKDATHGFGLPPFNIGLSLEPGETTTFQFTADTVGTFAWYCTEFCSALHLEMMGYLQVEE